MRAEFIGKTSMGFITGHIYTIETACKMVKRCKTSRGIIQRVVHFVRKDVPLFYIFSKNPPQK